MQREAVSPSLRKSVESQKGRSGQRAALSGAAFAAVPAGSALPRPVTAAPAGSRAAGGYPPAPPREGG